MAISDTLRHTSIRLNYGSVSMPAAGFGTLIPDPLVTKQATKTALEAGFRHLDCAELYRSEEVVGAAMQELFKAGTVRCEDVFVTTKLWNSNHRPKRIKPAFDACRRRLRVDVVDCYVIHTPFAFQPGDDRDPRDARGSKGRAGARCNKNHGLILSTVSCGALRCCRRSQLRICNFYRSGGRAHSYIDMSSIFPTLNG